MSKKSEVVRGFGFAMQIGAMIEAARQKLEVSDDDFHILGTPEGQKHIECMLAGLKSISLATNLVPVDEISLHLCAGLDPSEFFKTRHGLYVGWGFINRIGQSAKVIETGGDIALKSFDLKKNMDDSEIWLELPKDPFDGELEFCPMLAALINGQSHGERGALKHNGYKNIFFVRMSSEIFTVNVFWHSGAAHWVVDARPLNDVVLQYVGVRVFSRN